MHAPFYKIIKKKSLKTTFNNFIYQTSNDLHAPHRTSSDWTTLFQITFSRNHFYEKHMQTDSSLYHWKLILSLHYVALTGRVLFHLWSLYWRVIVRFFLFPPNALVCAHEAGYYHFHLKCIYTPANCLF